MPSAAVAFRALFACPLLEPNASDCTHCTVRCSDLTVSRDSVRRASGVSLVLRLALALLRARGGSLAYPSSSSSLSRWRLQEGSSSTGRGGDSDGIDVAFGHGRRPPYKAMHVVAVLLVLQQARRTRCPADQAIGQRCSILGTSRFRGFTCSTAPSASLRKHSWRLSPSLAPFR